MFLLESENIKFPYGKKIVLNGISLSLRKGEIAGILGPNGSGKTTLLKCLGGILKGFSGKILIEGMDIKKMNIKERAKYISYMPQFFDVPFGYTVEDIVSFGRYVYQKDEDIYGEKEAVKRALEEANLSDRRKSLLNHLSGGEKQRVFLAQMFAQDSKIMLLDEPVSHLDIKHKISFMKILIKKVREEEKSSLIIFHDINLASFYCDKIYFVKNGKIICEGNPEEIITAENIEKLFDISVDVIKKENGKIFTAPKNI